MSWFSRLPLIRGREARATLSSPQIADLLGATTGTHVSNERAASIAVAYRAIQARAEAIASVPLRLYRRTENGGRERIAGTPLADLLDGMMGTTLTAFEGRELLSAWADVHGNSFAWIETDGRGQVIALHPMAPGSTTVERLAGGALRFTYTDLDGRSRVFLQGEVLHIRHRSRDGLLGVSPIQQAAATMALAVEQTEQAANMARNGFHPGGLLTLPAAASGDQMEMVRRAMADRHAGGARAGRLMILDGGWTYKSMSLTAADAEFIESRKLSNLDVARIYGVPPTVVGITDNATYSNVTQENRAFVARCLAPWAKRIESAMNAALLTPEQRKTMFIEHDLSGLLRGDVEARFEAYRIGREGGWLSANDIRTMENMAPIEGGDAYLRPLNMADASEGNADGDA